MNKNYKSNERELINVVNFFKRQSKKLFATGKLGEEHVQIEESVDRFIEQMSAHADVRAAVMNQRTLLSKIVKDDAACPRCRTKDMIKLVGTEKNEKGWKSNRYKCRKCNIQFTWNAPNNPWDLLAYVEDKLQGLQEKLESSDSSEDKALINESLNNTRQQLESIKPVILAHDKEYNLIIERDTEMEKMIHEVKNSLLIEKVRMDTWENKKGRNK